MRDRVIKYAIMYPHVNPISKLIKEGRDITKDEVDKIIKEEKINGLSDRRIISWQLERLIYLAASKAKNQEDIINEVQSQYGQLGLKLKVAETDLIRGMIQRKDFNDINKILIYQKFISNDLIEEESVKYNKIILNWSIDLATYYTLCKSKLDVNRNNIIKKVENCLQKMNTRISYNSESIEGKLQKYGLFNDEVIKTYYNGLNRYFYSFSELLINLLNTDNSQVDERKSDEDDTSIFNLSDLDCMLEDLKVDNHEEEETTISNDINPVTENKEKEESDNSVDKNVEDSIGDNKINAIIDNLNNMAKVLGYKLVEENPNSTLDHSEYALFKKLVSLENGSVLPDLYNVFKNIKDIDVENIEAALGNFFATIFAYGLQVEDHVGDLGEDITVNTKDILTKFIFSKEVTNEGDIKGKIKHYGWSVNGKMLSPLVVEPQE